MDDEDDEELLFSSPVELRKQLKKKNFVIKDCTIKIIIVSPFVFKFCIIDSNSETHLSGDIASILTPQFSLNELTFYFLINYSTKRYIFHLVFENKEDIANFANIYCRCLFEKQNQRHILNSDLPQIKRLISEMCIDQEEEEFIEEEEQEQEQEVLQQDTDSADGGHNFLLRIAPRTSSSIVMRKYNDHCNLKFFTNDKDCHFTMMLPNITDRNGSNISTSDMLTNNSDHGLLLLDQNRPTEIFDMNLDRGLVINQYNAIDSMNDSHPVSRILHTCQNDSTQPVFIGFNNKNTMLFDTRVPKPIVNRSDYKGNNQFISGITTKSGRIAMGSNDGIIRLFKSPCRNRATVNFYVGNEPITAIDVSPDEDWIVATCPNYISTFSVLSQSTHKLAFDFPMKDEKSPIIKLYVSQNDQQIIAQNNGGNLLPFTSAKFELNSNTKIVAIVASIGNALVSWNFSSILNDHGAARYIIKYISNDPIIDNQPLQSSNVLFMSQNFVSVAEMSSNNNSRHHHSSSNNNNDSDNN